MKSDQEADTQLLSHIYLPYRSPQAYSNNISHNGHIDSPIQIVTYLQEIYASKIDFYVCDYRSKPKQIPYKMYLYLMIHNIQIIFL